jgi:hypothetical protein
MESDLRPVSPVSITGNQVSFKHRISGVVFVMRPRARYIDTVRNFRTYGAVTLSIVSNASKISFVIFYSSPFQGFGYWPVPASVNSTFCVVYQDLFFLWACTKEPTSALVLLPSFPLILSISYYSVIN